jgi:hypothetical protein
MKITKKIQKNQKTILTLTLVCMLAMGTPLLLKSGNAIASPFVEVRPASQTVNPGDDFDVQVYVDSDTYDLKAVQIDLYYDGSVFSVNTITEGTLFGTAKLTEPGSGEVATGHIHYGMTRTGTSHSPESGVFITINFAVDGGASPGVYDMDLEDDLRDGTSAVIPGVMVNDGTVEVSSPCANDPDVNDDGNINVLDMIRVGQHWGETGPDGWIPEDITCDGTIDVLDMILIGQNWTG